jgi:hypothetical protein
MSWEELSRSRHPCPCGKGEYEEIHLMDDWNRSETHQNMLCNECAPRYTYSSELIGGMCPGVCGES